MLAFISGVAAFNILKNTPQEDRADPTDKAPYGPCLPTFTCVQGRGKLPSRYQEVRHTHLSRAQ